ncbi:DUF2924 domain-containing protein [Candidatus Eisenbacteria bacterium]|uniref:DUF2924 domain-containing protein n=1 Tax=Eiseniibacteriota bacterium TaxID=2212470 RepID=A0ABV6YKJ5_UNCEI
MSPAVRKQIDELADLSVAELREEYVAVFGETTRSRHKRFLQKRIAWGLQANEQGGLSERALRRARELARDADLRLLAPKPGKTTTRKFIPSHDRRLPDLGARR